MTKGNKGARKLVATFANGDQVFRTTDRPYAAAWRVWSNNPQTQALLRGRSYQTKGFSHSIARAHTEADRYVRGLTANTGWVDLLAEVATVEPYQPKETTVKKTTKRPPAKPAAVAAPPTQRAPVPLSSFAPKPTAKSAPIKQAAKTIRTKAPRKPAPAAKSAKPDPVKAYQALGGKAPTKTPEQYATEQRKRVRAGSAKVKAKRDRVAEYERRSAATHAANARSAAAAKEAREQRQAKAAPPPPPVKVDVGPGQSKADIVYAMLRTKTALARGVTEAEIAKRVGWARARSAMVRRTEMAGLRLDIIIGGPGEPTRYRAVSKSPALAKAEIARAQKR